MSADLDAIRARAAVWHTITVSGVDALLALVDAQAARIDKALALHDTRIMDRCRECGYPRPCPTVRALTEDTP